MNISGEAIFKVKRSDGSVVTRKVKNLIVQWALDAIADAIIGTPLPATIEYLAMGDSNTSANLGDTQLGNELRRDQATVTKVTGEPNKIQYDVAHATGTVTGTFREAGLFDANTGGNMFNRMTFADLVVDALDTLTVTWIITVRNA